MREVALFEIDFPAPKGVIWNEDLARYTSFPEDALACAEQNGRWEVWQKLYEELESVRSQVAYLTDES